MKLIGTRSDMPVEISEQDLKAQLEAAGYDLNKKPSPVSLYRTDDRVLMPVRIESYCSSSQTYRFVIGIRELCFDRSNVESFGVAEDLLKAYEALYKSAKHQRDFYGTTPKGAEVLMEIAAIKARSGK